MWMYYAKKHGIFIDHIGEHSYTYAYMYVNALSSRPEF